MTLLYGAAVCVVGAQVLGIYALRSHKADLVFSAVMIALLVFAAALGYMGARQQLG